MEYDAHCTLTNILKNNEVAWNLPREFKGMEELSVREHAKKINMITPEIFYYNAFFRSVMGRIYYSEKESYSIKNNTYEGLKSYEANMFLILNCIYLLDNPEPITEEQRYKIGDVLINSRTFIFNSCKVTLYNNGRLIIKFSNPELFKRFENKVNSTIKILEKDLKRQEV